MREKKDRERFSIKFNENDPAHDEVIRLLEKQGAHSKAQFIVNAVLHYVNCKEVSGCSRIQTPDQESIEKVVMKILNQDRGRLQDELTDESREKEQEVTYQLIADTMSAFRSG